MDFRIELQGTIDDRLSEFFGIMCVIFEFIEEFAVTNFFLGFQIESEESHT